MPRGACASSPHLALPLPSSMRGITISRGRNVPRPDGRGAPRRPPSKCGLAPDGETPEPTGLVAYQRPRPVPDTDIEETLSVLSDLMRAGKDRAIGTSTLPAADLVEAQWVAERRGLARF